MTQKLLAALLWLALFDTALARPKLECQPAPPLRLVCQPAPPLSVDVAIVDIPSPVFEPLLHDVAIRDDLPDDTLAQVGPFSRIVLGKPADVDAAELAEPLVQIEPSGDRRFQTGGPQIIAPATVPVHSLVTVRVVDAAEILDMLVLTSLNNSIEFVTVVQSRTEGEFVFTGPPGTYSIRVKCKDESPMIARVVIGTGPKPDPDPEPKPKPKPIPDPDPIVVIPEGVHGLTKACYTAALRVPLPARNRAKAIGENFSGVASAIAAGAFPTFDAANLELKNRNATTVADVRDAWLPWFTVEAGLVLTLFRNGDISTLPQLADAYHAVADGLKLVP